MADTKKGKQIVDKLTEKVTLKMFRVGCDPRNYHVLKKLPLTATEIEKELSLTAMPTNRRIKELMETGLISREKAGEDIKITDLGKYFLKYIAELRNLVVKHMAEII